MAGKFLNMKNLKFTLQQLIAAHTTQTFNPFEGHNKKSIDLLLDAAFEFSKKALHPIFEEMDRNAPELKNGTVAVHPDVKKIMTSLGQDGWIAAPFPEKWGGEEMPGALLNAVYFIFASANYSGSVYSGLTTGAAKLILTYGSEYLKSRYLPPMLEGRWQGTMALTEPEAGSSLGDLVTSAKPLQQLPKDSCESLDSEQKIFLISGEKIFISAGDHDGVDNIVHLLLARIEGAPAGVKGISLFVVPKFRLDNKNSLVSNDVTVTQTFHKLGYRGAPITALSFGDRGDCMGWLVGEPNKGLSYMFQMMNGARLDVGMGATAIAAAAYEAALEYTKQRKQGRRLSDGKSGLPVPIIEHQDVKRMLLFQRSVWEGSLALILQCSIYEDIINALSVEPGVEKTAINDLHKDKSIKEKNLDNEENADEKERYHLLLEILTPVAKTFPSEMGILSTSQSLQCFGGYGYCEDFPVEQHFRDMRIHAIHEGTTGIQGMDLLGRKVIMQDGKALKFFCQEVEKTIKKASTLSSSISFIDNQDKKAYGVDCKEVSSMAEDMKDALKILTNTTRTLGVMAMERGADAFLANATLYLEMFGYVVIGWQWLSQALAAMDKLSCNDVQNESSNNIVGSGKTTKKSELISKSDRLFYEGKIIVCRYFFCHELPKIKPLSHTLTLGEPVGISMSTAHFTS